MPIMQLDTTVPITPVLWVVRDRWVDPWGSLTGQTSQSASSQVQQRTLAQKLRWRAAARTADVSSLCVHRYKWLGVLKRTLFTSDFTCICTHMHAYSKHE